MNVHLLSDGRVFDGEEAEYKAGDVAWFEEDILLVTEIVDGTAQAIVHPAACEMMGAALDKTLGGLATAMHIHAGAMAGGYLAALAFIKTADLNSTADGRASISAGFAEFHALRELRDDMARAQEIVRPVAEHARPRTA
jgi:hypothetical protein